MVYREIVAEAKQLPLHEQLQLIEELARYPQDHDSLDADRRDDVIPFKLLRGALRPAAGGSRVDRRVR